jgi:hypothetical protein
VTVRLGAHVRDPAYVRCGDVVGLAEARLERELGCSAENGAELLRRYFVLPETVLPFRARRRNVGFVAENAP